MQCDQCSTGVSDRGGGSRRTGMASAEEDLRAKTWRRTTVVHAGRRGKSAVRGEKCLAGRPQRERAHTVRHREMAELSAAIVGPAVWVWGRVHGMQSSSCDSEAPAPRVWRMYPRTEVLIGWGEDHSGDKWSPSKGTRAPGQGFLQT